MATGDLDTRGSRRPCARPAWRRYPEIPSEVIAAAEFQNALRHIVSEARSSVLSEARRVGTRVLKGLLESTEALTMPQTEFQDDQTVGDCTRRVLAMPPCDAEHQGMRTELGTCRCIRAIGSAQAAPTTTALGHAFRVGAVCPSSDRAAPDATRSSTHRLSTGASAQA